MTDIDNYMTMLRESQLKRTIVIKDVDKIILENEQLKELLQECRNRLDTYYSDLIKKIDEVLK